MTPPRQRYKGKTYLIIRRICFGLALLTPSRPDVAQILGYCMTEAAEQTGVKIHAVAALPSFMVAVVTDPQALLPKFEERQNVHIARCMNALLGRSEYLWGPGSYTSVTLESDEEILEAIADVICLPTTVGLVREPKKWEGLLTLPGDVNGGEVIARPEHYFSAKGAMPEAVALRYARPECFREMDADAYQAMIEERVRAKVKAVREEFKATKRTFLGMERVKKLKPNRPWSCEWIEQWFKECKELEHEQLFEGEWQDVYQQQRRDWIGDKSVLLPEGAFWLPRYAGAETAPLETLVTAAAG